MGVLWGDHAPSCLGKKGGRVGRGRSHFGTTHQGGVLHVPSPVPQPVPRASPERAVCRAARGLNWTFMGPRGLPGRFMGRRPSILDCEWGPSAISFSFNLSFVPSFNTRYRLAALECGPAQKHSCGKKPGGRKENHAALLPGLGHSVGPLRVLGGDSPAHRGEVAPGSLGLPDWLAPARPMAHAHSDSGLRTKTQQCQFPGE